MFIGTKSDSTILNVIETGIKELTRMAGIPSDVRFNTPDCTITIYSADMSKGADKVKITFAAKEDTSPDAIQTQLQQAKIHTQVVLEEGKCTIVLPPFTWRQMKHLVAVDEALEANAVRSFRSQSWKVTPRKYKRHDVNINKLIEEMKARKASDLHMRAGSPPFIRVDNLLEPLDMPPVSAHDMEEVVNQLGSEEEVRKLQEERESSFQFHAAGVGYLRCSGYYKQGAIAMAIRLIPEEPMPFDQLSIPDVVRKVCDKHRGLFLVAGVTGSGKSTTLAAMVDHINQTRHAHVITVEDPIEYVYTDKKSIVSQRQVGRDTYSFANGLKGALREDPDVILVGEMRDVETIRAGISAAETGHLVFSTLHTMTAVDTVNRVISYFPQNERDLIRQELAYSLQGVVCQRLLRRKEGGRVPCLEILLGGRPIVRDAILEADIERLYNIIEVDSDMKSFDQYAVELFQEGVVEKSEAVSACANEESFERIISGIKSSEGRKLLG